MRLVVILSMIFLMGLYFLHRVAKRRKKTASLACVEVRVRVPEDDECSGDELAGCGMMSPFEALFGDGDDD